MPGLPRYSKKRLRRIPASGKHTLLLSGPQRTRGLAGRRRLGEELQTASRIEHEEVENHQTVIEDHRPRSGAGKKTESNH